MSGPPTRTAGVDDPESPSDAPGSRPPAGPAAGRPAAGPPSPSAPANRPATTPANRPTGPNGPIGQANGQTNGAPAGPPTPAGRPPAAPAPDQASIAQRKRERNEKLAREIEGLARREITPEQFFAKLLDVLRAAMGAPAAAVWTLDAGALTLSHERGLGEAGFNDVPRADRAIGPLLSSTLATGESSVKNGADPAEQLPTGHLYLTAALVTEGTPTGALQVFQRADTPAASRSGYLQYVERLAGYASEYLTRQKARARQGGDLSAGNFWGEFEKAVLLLQRARGVSDVAGVAVNESRRLLDVDRVSLVRRRGRKYPVEAVSGQDTVHKRANLIRRLSRLAKAVMRTREPLLFTGGHAVATGREGFSPAATDDSGELPPQISEPLSAYLEEAGSRMVAVVPLFASDRDLGKEDLPPEERHRQQPPEVIGALVVEQIAESRLAPGLTSKLDLLNDHVAAALQSAREDERIFLRGPLRTLGRATEYLHGRKLIKTLAITGALTALALALWLVPYPYRVTGEGVLVPAEQRRVFAPFDGEVTGVLVEGGDRVTVGQPLLRIRNVDLVEQVSATEVTISEKQTQIRSLTAQAGAADRRLDEAEADRLRGERSVVEVELEGLTDTLERLRERAEKSVVRSPLAGTVATFQLDRLLRDRPVGRGEVLLEVMDDDGPWRLELNVADTRAGRLDDAIAEHGGIDLPVSFVVASDPETTFDATLTRIVDRAEPDADLGNVLAAYASLDDPDALPQRRIGTEVTAKIDCGPAPLFTVLFGDVVEFVQRNLWL